MRLIRSIILVALALGTFFSSCVKETDYTKAEIAQIEEFMVEQDMLMEPTESGLYFKDVIVGTGDFVNELDTVEVFYTGYFLSGIKFSGNVGGNLFQFVVNDSPAWVIPGWEEGIKYMKEGGEAMMIVPSWLAYGTSGRGSIPGYTPLFFEIELVNIIRGPNSK